MGLGALLSAILTLFPFNELGVVTEDGLALTSAVALVASGCGKRLPITLVIIISVEVFDSLVGIWVLTGEIFVEGRVIVLTALDASREVV